MADSNFPTLISKDADANLVTNPVFVTMSDGTTALNFTGTSADVNVTNTVTVDAANLDIRDLVHTGDSIQIGDGTATTLDISAVDAAAGVADTGIQTLGVRNDTLAALGGTDGDYVPFQMNADGALYVTLTGTASDPTNVVADDSAFVVGTGTIGVMGALADEAGTDSVDEGDVGVPRMTLDRKLLIEIADATTDSQRLAINASGEVGVVQATHGDLNANVTLQINDVDVSASVPVPISRTAAANAEENPIYVTVVEQVASGNEIHDYDTQASLAGAGTDNHDYTVAGTTFFLKSVRMSSSGGGKLEVQTGPVGTLVSVDVGFIPKHGGTITLVYNPAIEVTGGVTPTVRAIRTNREGSAQDVYSLIQGSDVA